MKIYLLKKYAICSFFILILLTLLYMSMNNINISILNNLYVYATSERSEKKVDKNSNVDIYSNTKTNENSEEMSQENNKESSSKTNQASGDDMVNLLARLINGEARGEPYEGQVAVGAVILNRVKSPKFPNTIASVIYQNGQFTCVRDGQFNQPIDENSTVYKAATEAMNGADPTNGALYFYNPSKTQSKWLFSLKTTTTIGKHRFALGE